MNTLTLQQLRKILLLSILFMNCQVTYAVEKEDTRNPIGCTDVGYEFTLKTLHLFPHAQGASQAMYVIYNTSNQTITLYQMRDEDSSRSMYMNHALGTKQWGVLSTSENKMKYICTVPDSKLSYGRIIDCADNLRVCEYANVKYGMNNRGNFWLLNSSSKNGAINAVVHYGIIPGV